MSVLKKAREKFFNDCDYVVMAPGSFYWTGEYSVEFGHPAILQTINNHVYVGLKLNCEKIKVIINRIKRSAPSYSIDKIDPQTHYVNYDKHSGELKQYIDVLKTKLNDWLVMHRIQSKFDDFGSIASLFN